MQLKQVMEAPEGKVVILISISRTRTLYPQSQDQKALY